MFTRKLVPIPPPEQDSIHAAALNSHSTFIPTPQPLQEEVNVLVINSGKEMAKEITHELNLALPGCSIMYAPSLDLACWILKRRHIDLIVSSSILPDGQVGKLEPVLAKLNHKPDVVVVGQMGEQYRHVFRHSNYQFATFRQLDSQPRLQPDAQAAPKSPKPIRSRLSVLGADLRNDLNNPLQEIVAMVFVAKNSPSSTPLTAQALDAIDKAAQNMSHIVNRLEDRIRSSLASK